MQWKGSGNAGQLRRVTGTAELLLFKHALHTPGGNCVLWEKARFHLAIYGTDMVE